MSTQKSDAVRLRHMRDAAREALEIGKERRPDDLRQDRLRTLALVKAIEIIGEAAARISAAFRGGTPADARAPTAFFRRDLLTSPSSML